MTNAPARPPAATGSPTANPAQVSAAFTPPPIRNIEDTGLSPLWLQDLVLKVMYFQGYRIGYKIVEEIAPPF